MLGHLSDTATAPRVGLDALDVLPERIGEKRGLQRGAAIDYSHGFYGHLVFQ